MGLKGKILEVLEKEGKWVPSFFVAEKLGEKSLVKAEKTMKKLADLGIIKANMNLTLNIRYYHALRESEE